MTRNEAQGFVQSLEAETLRKLDGMEMIVWVSCGPTQLAGDDYGVWVHRANDEYDDLGTRDECETYLARVRAARLRAIDAQQPR